MKARLLMFLHHALFWLAACTRSSRTLVPTFDDPWPGTLIEGQNIYRGIFQFWNEQADTADPRFWSHPSLTPGFKVILHGFEWLRSLRQLNTPQSRGVARHYIRHWIENHHTWDPLIWAPDVVGQRLASWLGFFDFFGSTADHAFLEQFTKSVSRQITYLEWVHRITPLYQLDTQSLKGLLLGKIACKHPIDATLKRLEWYLDQQILADGSHKSRTPMSQLMALRDLLDLRLTLKNTEKSSFPKLNACIQKLAAVVRFLRHGDGALAIFFNSAEGNSFLVDTILSHGGAPKKTPQHLSEGGFFRVQKGQSLLLFDVGTPVMHQPLSQDRLGFEFSYGTHRLVSNGTRPIQPSPLLHPLSPDVSGTLIFFDDHYRVLREDTPESAISWNTSHTHDESVDLISADWEQRISRERFRHQRTLSLLNDGKELRGEDLLIAPPGFSGVLRITFHPTVHGEILKGKSAILLTLNNGQKWRFMVDRSFELTLNRGYYYGIDNKELFCPQAVIKIKCAEPSTLVKWSLQKLES